MKKKKQNTGMDNVGNSNQCDVNVKDVPVNKKYEKKIRMWTMLVTITNVM